MQQREFSALVHRLEAKAQASPGAFRYRVVALAGLSYAYVLLNVLVCAGLLAAAVALMVATRGRGAYFAIVLGLSVLGMLWAMLRALIFRVPPIAGRAVDRGEFPRLTAMVDDVARQLGGVRVDGMWLTDAFNASATQRPLLGLFGGYRNHLSLGLPLMMCVSAEQLRAIVAHELGHFGGAHGRIGMWIGRTYHTWAMIEARLADRGWSAFTLRWFAQRFTPYFHAHALVLSRAQEWEADRAAARIAGPEVASQALMALQIGDRMLQERFWKQLNGWVLEHDAPVPDVFSRMSACLSGGVTQAQAGEWIGAVLRQKTDIYDSHPALAERMAIMGQPLPEEASASTEPCGYFVRPEASAASELLGERLPAVMQEFSGAWAAELKEDWAARHKHVKQQAEELSNAPAAPAAVEAAPSPAGDAPAASNGDKAAVQALWERAVKVMDVRGDEEAMPELRRILEVDPRHAPAHFEIARILLERTDAAGMDHLRRAIECDGACGVAASEMAEAYCRNIGDLAAAEQWREEYERHAKVIGAAELERAGITADDTLIAHGVAEQELAPMREQLQGWTQVREAYLVRKQVFHFPDKPMYALFVTRRQPWYLPETQRAAMKLAEQLVEKLRTPGPTIIYVITSELRWLVKRAKKVEGSLIYDARRAAAPAG